MDDSTYAIFLGFGLLWVVMAGIAFIALLKADGQKLQFGPNGLIVAIPIVLVIAVALIFGVIAGT
ncbi:hypothetical protein [Leptolyngbya sp. FACHB-261]|uniref:hypothetical protein n=1 Tax=Leptolyngbya sp. FACHB-261 TaxID=2692806 RepID=UPI00168628EA|nr:hypothetical protein [Leptolyngbya sp. FACHB-261]MBD2101514.1 hypothetical protein [Leptolyngbya sp. FACHB-261]